MAEQRDAAFRLLISAPRPRELSGSLDLKTQFGLLPSYEAFFKESLPPSIAETHYLKSIDGNSEIRKGEGMESMQCSHNLRMRENISQIKPFDLDVLRQAFELRESGPIQLSEADKGIQTISGEVKHECRDKDKIHKHQIDKDKDKIHKHQINKDKDKIHKHQKDKDKDKDHKKHKHRHKDKDKEKRKDKSTSHEKGDDKSKKHHKKKRKHEGHQEDGDSHKHKKRKHKDSKADDRGHMKN